MKRFIDWVNKLVKKYTWQKVVATSIGIVVSIPVFLFCYIFVDKVPVTALDYEPLEKQIIAIQENRDLLFSTDGDVNIKDGVITITLTTLRCKLTTKLDQNFNVLGTPTKESFVKSWFTILLMTILLGCACGLLVAMLSWPALWLVYFLVWWLPKKLYNKFRKFQNG